MLGPSVQFYRYPVLVILPATLLSRNIFVLWWRERNLGVLESLMSLVLELLDVSTGSLLCGIDHPIRG
jgi:hypothetical protein